MVNGKKKATTAASSSSVRKVGGKAAPKNILWKAVSKRDVQAVKDYFDRRYKNVEREANPNTCAQGPVISRAIDMCIDYRNTTEDDDSLEILKILLKNGLWTNYFKKKLPDEKGYEWSTQHKDVRKDRGVVCNYWDMSAVYLQVVRSKDTGGHLDVVKCLHRYGGCMEPNRSGFDTRSGMDVRHKAIHDVIVAAVENKHTNVLKFLLETQDEYGFVLIYEETIIAVMREGLGCTKELLYLLLDKAWPTLVWDFNQIADRAAKQFGGGWLVQELRKYEENKAVASNVLWKSIEARNVGAVKKYFKPQRRTALKSLVDNANENAFNFLPVIFGSISMCLNQRNTAKDNEKSIQILRILLEKGLWCNYYGMPILVDLGDRNMKGYAWLQVRRKGVDLVEYLDASSVLSYALGCSDARGVLPLSYAVRCSGARHARPHLYGPSVAQIFDVVRCLVKYGTQPAGPDSRKRMGGIDIRHFITFDILLQCAERGFGEIGVYLLNNCDWLKPLELTDIRWIFKTPTCSGPYLKALLDKFKLSSATDEWSYEKLAQDAAKKLVRPELIDIIRNYPMNKIRELSYPLPARHPLNGELCSICYDDFQRYQQTTTLPCKHTFCHDCITKLVETKTFKCPYCRQAFA